MLSYKILNLVYWLMIFSVGYFVGELLVKKFGNKKEIKFLFYARIVLFVISVCMLVWLLFNKELFHWNFDIATGEPVNHYSTFGRCVAYTIIALLSNTGAYLISKNRKTK